MQTSQRQKQSIENDLSSFLKRVRQREQQHHKLCDYTNKLLARQDELEQALQIHDEIRRHHSFLKQILVVDLTHQEADGDLSCRCDKYLNVDEQNMLGRRVVSRVLEVTYAAIDTFRQFREYYSQGYLGFKEKCVKAMAQQEYKTSFIVKITSKYLTQKIRIEAQRLKQAISCLQINEYELFTHLKFTYYDMLPKKQLFMRAQKSETPTLILVRKNIWKREESFNPEKQIKREIRVRTKAKSNKEKEKMRRADMKKIKKLAGMLTQVLDVEKEDLLQDMGPENKQWMGRKFLSTLISRNKTNQNHILTFRQKEEAYLEVLSSPPPKSFGKKIHKCQSLEQEVFEQAANFIEEDIKKNAFTVRQIPNIQSSSPKRQPSGKMRYDRRESMRQGIVSGTKRPQKRQRTTLNNIQQLDLRNKSKQIFSSQKLIMQQDSMVEINLKGAIKLPKARFPEITPRAVSVSRSKLQKEEELTVRNKLQTKPNNTYFEEIEKKILKFCQIKRNLAV